MIICILLLFIGFFGGDNSFGSEFSSRRDQFMLSAGPTYYLYSESFPVLNSGTDFKQFGLTSKIFYRHQYFPTRWNADFSIFFTALPMTASTGVPAKVLGGSAKFGYMMPLGSSWGGGVSGGWYGSTMFVLDNSFGYKNVTGPQVVPTIRKILHNGSEISAYFRYSPVSAGGLSFEGSTNREIAIGAGWIRPLRNGASFSIMVDAEDLRFGSAYQVAAVPDIAAVKATSFSVSAGFGW